MPRPILNVDALEYRPWGHGERFEARVGDIAAKIGAQKLGYNVTVVPPGKRAYPAHSHRVNEEMFYIIEGQGELRVGNERYPVRAGDIIACPPGGPETAHQIVNTSRADIRYLSVSTMLLPEIVDYPDSNKFGVRYALPPDEKGQPRSFRFLGRLEDGIKDYWDGE
jgi:uncharacterized cupin superfamily protein